MSVTAANAIEKIQECEELLAAVKWDEFESLYASIAKLQEGRKNTPDSDPINVAWKSLRRKGVDDLMKVLESSKTYEDFAAALRKLAKIVDNSQKLWHVMEKKINSELKVTLHQSQLLAAEFFTPEELFEFGFEDFSKTSICDMSNLNNEEAVVDIFYAVAGYVIACNLPKTYMAHLPCYSEFVAKMLTMFMQLPDFDPHRFVWLVEVIHEHLHIQDHKLYEICGNVIKEYIDQNMERSSTTRLYKLCVISTSPFLKSLAMVKESIDALIKVVITDQEIFLRKYLFTSFVNCNWDTVEDTSCTDAFKCWKMYIVNMATNIQERPEYPAELLATVLDNSLILFEGYYAEVQPIKQRSASMRLDIFGIVETVEQYYPMELSDDSLRRCWYLLYIAAVSGAGDLDLQNAKPAMRDVTESPGLDLDIMKSDFVDYKLALERCSKKFESEFGNFQAMVEFIRKNY